MKFPILRFKVFFANTFEDISNLTDAGKSWKNAWLVNVAGSTLSLVDELGALPQWRSLELRTIHQLVSGGACAGNLHPSVRRSSRNLVSAANWQFPTQGRTSSPLPEHASPPAAPEPAGRVGPCSPLGLWSVLWTRSAGTPRLTSLQIPAGYSALVSRASTVRETTCVTNFHESYR